jgi:hypothetical protein
VVASGRLKACVAPPGQAKLSKLATVGRASLGDETSKNIAQHPLKGADGAVDPVPKIILVINLPPRLRLQGGYRIFIYSAAATPPNLGGEFSTRLGSKGLFNA